MKTLCLVGALAGLLLPATLLAHHSSAMFDNTKWTTLKGTVVEYRWENPHMHILIKVPADPANPKQAGNWDIEGASVNIMARQGWTKISYKPGDPIVAVTHPMVNGDHGASLSYVIKADGSHMYMNEGRPDQAAPGAPPAAY